MIHSAKQKAEYQVNSTIIDLYQSIGEYVSKQVDVNGWGKSRSLSQTMIAEYKTKLIDKSILQRKLAELYDIAEEEVKNSQQD